MEFPKEKIGKEYDFVSLIKFAIPTIIMMVFMSVYTIIDGLYVSRFVSTSALSAINIVYPMNSIILAIGLMLATGGSAVIAKKMGEDKLQEAKENFTLIIAFGSIIGFIIMILGHVFINPMLKMLGAGGNEELFRFSFDYLTVLLYFSPLAILQMIFQSFFIVAGKPSVGLTLTLLGGCVNIVLDYIFIVPLQMGIIGAAVATGIGMAIPAVFGLIYFTFYKKGILYFVKLKSDRKVLLRSCINGSSEMVSNLSVAVVTFLYNIIVMKYLGVDGVAAITIMLYVQFLLTAVFFGFSMGVSPIISYHYGSGNVVQLKKIFKYGIIFNALGGLFTFGISSLYGSSLVGIMVNKDNNVYRIALDGFKIFSISFLFSGFNIYTSAMFTAFSNGKVSAIISFMRTFVFISVSLLLLPLIIGVKGVWWAVPIAELFSMMMCIIYLNGQKKSYNYV